MHPAALKSRLQETVPVPLRDKLPGHILFINLQQIDSKTVVAIYAHPTICLFLLQAWRFKLK
jgi:hypothetical protein